MKTALAQLLMWLSDRLNDAAWSLRGWPPEPFESVDLSSQPDDPGVTV